MAKRTVYSCTTSWVVFRTSEFGRTDSECLEFFRRRPDLDERFAMQTGTPRDSVRSAWANAPHVPPYGNFVARACYEFLLNDDGDLEFVRRVEDLQETLATSRRRSVAESDLKPAHPQSVSEGADYAFI